MAVSCGAAPSPPPPPPPPTPPAPPSPGSEDLNGRRRFPYEVNNTIQALLPPRCIGSGDLPGRIGCVGVPRSVITARRNARFEHADCNQSGVVGCVRLPHASLIGGASHGRSEVIFTGKEAGSLTLPRLPHLGNRTTQSVALDSLQARLHLGLDSPLTMTKIRGRLSEILEIFG